MYSWSWVYACTYMGILLFLFGQYLPNTTVSHKGGFAGFIAIFLLVRIPNIFIYSKTAKNKGHSEATTKIFRIELIAFLLGLAFFFLFSLVIILKHFFSA